MQTGITWKFFNQSVGFCKFLMVKVHRELTIRREKAATFYSMLLHFVPSPYSIRWNTQINIKIHVRRAAGRRIFINSLVYVCICVYVYMCHASWPNEKRYRPEIWYTYSHRPYLKTGFKTGFLFFRRNPHDGR